MLPSSGIVWQGYFLWYWYNLRIYFYSNVISLRRHRISPLLVFSNRSFTLFTWKWHFLMRAKLLRSVKKRLTVQGVWYVNHWGCCSWINIKESLSLVWPKRNWNRETCFFFDFLNAGIQSPKVGLIKNSLLWMLLFYRICHLVWINLLIQGSKAVYRISTLSGAKSRPDLAAKSALSFLLTKVKDSSLPY